MRFTVSRKIIVAFSSVALIGFLGVVAVYAELAQTRERFHEITEIAEPLSAAAYEMEINVIGAALGVLKYLNVGTKEARWRVEKDEADFIRFKAQYDRLAKTPRHRELGNTLGVLHRQFMTLGKELMGTKDKHKVLSLQIAEQIHDIDAAINQLGRLG